MIEELLQEHQGIRFPSGYGGGEVEGIDLAILDADIAGCVETYIKHRKLDNKDTAILGLCYRDCAVVVKNLNGAAKDYFLRLEKLALLVLEAVRGKEKHMTKNKELIENLIPLWHATRLWAEDLLRRHLDLADATDILKPENRGNKPISGTNWMYRSHGVGVDVYKTEEVGGIDFDFDKPTPDPWRMKIFFRRQYNDGNLNFELYRDLFEDNDMLDRVLAELLEPRT